MIRKRESARVGRHWTSPRWASNFSFRASNFAFQSETFSKGKIKIVISWDRDRSIENKFVEFFLFSFITVWVANESTSAIVIAKHKKNIFRGTLNDKFGLKVIKSCRGCKGSFRNKSKMDLKTIFVGFVFLCLMVLSAKSAGIPESVSQSSLYRFIGPVVGGHAATDPN